jgi:hypothetical protein
MRVQNFAALAGPVLTPPACATFMPFRQLPVFFVLLGRISRFGSFCFRSLITAAWQSGQ